MTAVANGNLLSRRDHGGSTTWRWLAPSPMASYLATATNGRFQTRFERLPGGLWRFDAVDPQTREDEDDPPNPALAFERLDPEPRDRQVLLRPLRRLSVRERRRDHRLGARRRLRARVPDARQLRPHPGPVDRRPRARAPVVRRRGRPRGVARHLAQRGLCHLVGVDLRRAPRRRDRAGSLRRGLSRRRASAELLVPGAERAARTPRSCSRRRVYERGAMTLQALRVKVGDPTFFSIMRTWYRENRNRSVRTADFIRTAERVSRRDLDAVLRRVAVHGGQADQLVSAGSGHRVRSMPRCGGLSQRGSSRLRERGRPRARSRPSPAPTPTRSRRSRCASRRRSATRSSTPTAESEQPGEVEVEVKRPNGYLCLLVRDHGCGLAPRTDSPGLGLGLPLIAESASSLEVRTPGGGGTEIRMRFDLRTAAYTAG